ncbi:MAG TPA: efflux RND transporter periplasmic adaptor subunit [Kiritimatiellia bacterium]|nr:efflux RND transporter periplasmic adaptor subunit [Kiritimatiellia bacterium]
MKRNILPLFLKSAWKVLAGIAALLFLIVWTTGILNERVAPDSLSHEPGFPLPAGAETFRVQKQVSPSVVEIVGTVIARDRVQISSRIGASVSEVHVSAGQPVEKDQLLIRLDDREFREQIRAAEARVNLAEAEFRRQTRLFEAKATTEQQRNAAETEYHQALAILEQARIIQSYAEIRSPMAGIVSDRHIEPGDLASPGQHLSSVYNPDFMRLDIPVPVRFVDHIITGDPATVVFDHPQLRIGGVVSEIVSEINPSTRTRLVRVLLDQNDTTLFPGAFGRLQLEIDPRDDIVVPASSIYRVGQLEMAQVVRGDRVIRRLVRSGQTMGDNIEILSGLSDGETILIEPVLEK